MVSKLIRFRISMSWILFYSFLTLTLYFRISTQVGFIHFLKPNFIWICWVLLWMWSAEDKIVNLMPNLYHFWPKRGLLGFEPEDSFQLVIRVIYTVPECVCTIIIILKLVNLFITKINFLQIVNSCHRNLNNSHASGQI